MTYFNTGHYKRRQHFYGDSTADKPTTAYKGDKLTELDTGDEFTFDGTDWIPTPSETQDVKITDSDIAIPVDLQFQNLDESLPVKVDDLEKVKNLIGKEHKYFFEFYARDNDYLTDNFDLFYVDSADNPFEVNNYNNLRTIDDVALSSPAMLAPKLRPENSYSMLEIRKDSIFKDVAEKQSGVILRASEDLSDGVPEYGVIVYLEKSGEAGNFKVIIESELGVIDTAEHLNDNITISAGEYYSIHAMVSNNYEENKIYVNVHVTGTPVGEIFEDSFNSEIDLSAVDESDRNDFMKSVISGVYYGGEAPEAIDNWYMIAFGYDFDSYSVSMFGETEISQLLRNVNDKLDFIESELLNIKNVDGIKKIEDTVNTQVTGSIAEDDEQLTVTNAVKILTALTYGTATRALITVETADIRFRLTGADPTADLGHLLRQGECLILTSAEDIANFKAFADTGEDATIYVTYS